MEEHNCAGVSGSKGLVTVKDWFFAKDGQQYKAVYGDITEYDDMIVLGKGTPNVLFVPDESIITCQFCSTPPVKSPGIYFMEAAE